MQTIVTSRPRIVVIGGGFAGLWAVRSLRRAEFAITLIDRCNHHLFQPLLYQVATAGLAAPSIAAPLRRILRAQRNVTVILDEVVAIDMATQRVATTSSAFLYDYLVIASGATHSYFGHDAWRAHAPGLKTLDDALAIRGKILRAFECAEREEDAAERARWLNFVVVGGGATGVELAGTLAEIARHTLASEFRRIDPRQARVLLIEAGPRILPAFAPELSAKASAQLAALGVEVRLGTSVTNIGADAVSAGNEQIAARTVLWAAGVAASPLGKLFGVETDRAGRVHVAADLSVPGHANVFVAGDLAHVEQSGALVPGVAPAAKQMGAHVARVLATRRRGSAAPPFVYRDYGSLATIGRLTAVVQFGGLRMSGVAAWLFWLVAHIFFLIGFRNRIVVMIDWAWAYWTYARSARIIFGDWSTSESGRSPMSPARSNQTQSDTRQTPQRNVD